MRVSSFLSFLCDPKFVVVTFSVFGIVLCKVLKSRQKYILSSQKPHVFRPFLRSKIEVRRRSHKNMPKYPKFTTKYKE